MSHLKNIILYSTAQGNISVEVTLNDNTFSLTQKAMAQSFAVAVPAISKHLTKFTVPTNCKKKQLFPFWKQFKKKEPGI